MASQLFGWKSQVSSELLAQGCNSYPTRHCKLHVHVCLKFTLTSEHSVKTTLVTLMGLPRITISVIPLSRVLPNVMDLPFISGFISSALDTAAAEYVAPKSLTLDLQRLISGDDIKKGTSVSSAL